MNRKPIIGVDSVYNNTNVILFRNPSKKQSFFFVTQNVVTRPCNVIEENVVFPEYIKAYFPENVLFCKKNEVNKL